MEGVRHQSRPLCARPPGHAYYQLYGTVRGNPMGQPPPQIDGDTSGGRIKKHLNFLPWKKNKSKTDDMLQVESGNLRRHNKYKFGSVSALSVDALRKDWDTSSSMSSLSYAPSFSSASDLKHASVKSVGGRTRVVAYPWETYKNNVVVTKKNNNNQLSNMNMKMQLVSVKDKSKDTKNTVGEKLVFQAAPCICRKKKCGPFGTMNISTLKSSKCSCGFSSVRSSRGFAPPPPTNRKSILPQKVDLYSVREERDDDKKQNIYDTFSRSKKPRAPLPPAHGKSTLAPTNSFTSAQTKFIRSLEKSHQNGTFNSLASKKSILECDVTAYDLIKKYLKSNSIKDADSDVDDDLSDNILEEANKTDSDFQKPCSSADLKSIKNVMEKSPSPVSSESESGIYSQASSIRIGGHGMKLFSPDTESRTPSLYSEESKTNSVDSRASTWSNSSVSDDGIYSLPEPDYDLDKDNDFDIRPHSDDFTRSSYSPHCSSGKDKYSDVNISETICPESLNSQDFADQSDFSRFLNFPKCPTIGKSSSMISLAPKYTSESSEDKSREELPPKNESPRTMPDPPPPPPPPKPLLSPQRSLLGTGNLNIRSLESEVDVDISSPSNSIETGVVKLPKIEKGPGIFNISFAAELAEKLKGNQPLLRKVEIKEKPAIKNQPFEALGVKSILKKTGENLNRNREYCSSDISFQDPQEIQDTKKKKRVKFKSLSDESLVIEQIEGSLSSSDEEWEENKGTLDKAQPLERISQGIPSSPPNASNATLGPQQNAANHIVDGFQTVQEYLETKGENKHPNSVENTFPTTRVKTDCSIAAIAEKKLRQSVTKDDKHRNSLTTKLNFVTRPPHPPPPPPPPYTRKRSTAVCPPPRPINLAPKSASHSDLRLTGSSFGKKPALIRIASQERCRVGSQFAVPLNSFSNNCNSAMTNHPTSHNSSDSSRGLHCSQEVSSFPKNGVPSPAASLEVITSVRGKSYLETSEPDADDDMHHGCSESSTDGIVTHFIMRGTEVSRQNDGVISAVDDCESFQNKLSSEMQVGQSLGKAENAEQECLADVRHSEKIKTNVDTENTKNLGLRVSECRNDSTKEKYIDSCDQPISISITGTNDDSVLTKLTKLKYLKNGLMNRRRHSDLQLTSSAPSTVTCMIISSNDDRAGARNNFTEMNAKVGKSAPKDECTWNEEDAPAEKFSVEGPVYSNLLYVSGRDSHVPPPLPTTPPPSFHKPALQKCIGTYPFHRIPPNDDEHDLENHWELQRRRDSQVDLKNPNSIYESGRCNETGATIVTVSFGPDFDAAEHMYSSLMSRDIYEKLPENVQNPSDLNPFGQHRRSFFEGASKAEILNYLEYAKERVVHHLGEDDSDTLLDDEEDNIEETKTIRNNRIRISNISSSSESSTMSTNSSSSTDEDILKMENTNQKTTRTCSVEIERADSGVGTETSKPLRQRRASRSSVVDEEDEALCADCDQQVELQTNVLSGLECCPLVCSKCDRKRMERKEIVTEIVETEFKYGRDLHIIKEEFYTPMEVAALLTKDQLNGIFLNLNELIIVNSKFSEKLKDAVDIALEQGDEDCTTINIGNFFLETTSMLQAFEVYCIRQGSASMLLSNLEKEKELLRIFLRVSQMENTLLRRMNLSAFLMVPVQRVTKYPLLLNRLYKVTPYHHKDREALREAQLKIELHLEHINQQTKGITGPKIWRRISNISAANRRVINVSDIGSIQLRKMAIEILQWSKEEIRFVMAGKLSFSIATDFTRSRRGKSVKLTATHALLATLGKPNSNYRPDLVQESSILFPRNTGIRDATLLLMREKNGRYALAREPLHLGNCVISSELEEEDVIEIQEYTTKESIFLKADCKTEGCDWLKQLRYHAKDLGNWRKRRNALANIMINGTVRQ